MRGVERPEIEQRLVNKIGESYERADSRDAYTSC